MPELSIGQFDAVADSRHGKYVVGELRVGDGDFDACSLRILLGAREAETALRHIFALDDDFHACEANTRGHLHCGSAVFSAFI
jgi:hypothetical protein